MSVEFAPFLIGITGGTASGKSELATLLSRRFEVHSDLISQDWYYHDRSGLSDEEALKLNFDDPSAFDHELLHQHLLELKAGGIVQSPRYQYATHSRMEVSYPVFPRNVILVEGLLILHDPKIRRLLDYSVFIDVPADVRLVRRLKRDVAVRGVSMDETLRLYEHCVRPMHELYVQPCAEHASEVWTGLGDPSFPERFTEKLRCMVPALGGPQ